MFWKNLRATYYDQMKTMYQNLRSTGAWSYPKVEKMFEDHQSKWPEAIFNEDSWYKYLAPLVEKGSAAYISMLQGSKAEQRKWWMYNRFRYLDSKYNAGDAQTDVITLRGYAKADITVTPYADIYATIKYGSYLVQTRATRNNSYTLINPLDNVNDSEIYLFSASQLASIGDISGLKVGYAEFAHATRLQDLKIGDSSASYSNGNLTELYLGNNVLLKTIDVRNCPNLAQAVDLSGCTNIEEVYFDGTAITGLSLPVGGFLKKLHVPATMANLAIRNHKSLTELVVPSYSNLSSLRLENIGTTVNSKAILMALSANARVRLIGFYWEATNAAEIDSIFDKFDLMRGLDEYGNNTEKAQLSGTIHTASLTGAQIAGYNARYQDVRVIADHTTSYLTFANFDGTDTISTVECYDGVPQGAAPAGPARTSTAQYDYTFAGWSKTMDAETPDADALVDVLADRTVYAAYSRTLRTYTVTWKNYDNTVLETDTDVPYGTTPTYDGATPTYDGQTSIGWLPDPTQPITGDTTFTAQYLPVYTVTFKNETGSTTLDTQRVVQGGTAIYGGTTPVCAVDASLSFLGWATSANSHAANAVLTDIQADATVFAAFESLYPEVEITDTWDQIFAAIDNGTYATRYQLGYYKPLDLGDEGVIDMQIVAMDGDIDGPGGNTIPLTFVARNLLTSTSAIGTTTTSTATADGWTNSVLRRFLANDILPVIESNHPSLARRITAAYKGQSAFHSAGGYAGTYYTYDKLWVPSCYEIGGTVQRDTSACTYAPIVYDIKGHCTAEWWLRTQEGWLKTSGGKSYYYVKPSGDATAYTASTREYGIRLGFCLGHEHETITDSWETILANENYATDYKRGDTKELDLGTEGKHLMEIVGINLDTRADNASQKAGLTWISKTLLNTSKPMFNSSVSLLTNGWNTSDLRSYLQETILPLMPQVLQDGIVPVKKISCRVEQYGSGTMIDCNGIKTTDSVWIPSSREIDYTTNYSAGETDGPSYAYFSNDDKRIKKKLTGDALNYRLRTIASASGSRYVKTTGKVTGAASVTTSYAIALGFCTN